MNGRTLIIITLLSVSFAQVLFNCTLDSDLHNCSNTGCPWSVNNNWDSATCNQTYPQSNQYSASIGSVKNVVIFVDRQISVAYVQVGNNTNGVSQTLTVGNPLTVNTRIDVVNGGILMVASGVNSPSIDVNGQLSWLGGSINSNITVDENGVAQFGGNITFTGSANTMDVKGSSSFSTKSTTLTSDGTVTFEGKVLFNQGGVTLNGAGTYNFNEISFNTTQGVTTPITTNSNTVFGSIAVDHYASLTITNNAKVNGDLTSNGTITFAATNATNTFTYHTFENYGTYSWNSGLVAGNGIFTNFASATFNPTSGALSASNYSVDNHGTLMIGSNGATLSTTVNNDGVITLNGNLTVNSDFHHNGGVLNGTGTVYVPNGMFYWKGGNLDLSELKVRSMSVNENSTTVLSTKLTFKKFLDVDGAFVLSTGNQIYVDYKAEFNSYPGSIISTANSNGASIVNNGTMTGSFYLQRVSLTNNDFMGTPSSPIDSLIVEDADLKLGSESIVNLRVTSLTTPNFIVQRVNVNNTFNAHLDGQLYVYLVDGFSPNNGDTVSVINVPSNGINVTGGFTNWTIFALEGSNVNDCQWTPSQNISTSSYIITFHDCHTVADTTGSSSSSSSSNGFKIGMIVVIVVAVVVIVVIIIVAVVMYRRKHHVTVAEKQRLI